MDLGRVFLLGLLLLVMLLFQGYWVYRFGPKVLLMFASRSVDAEIISNTNAQLGISFFDSVRMQPYSYTVPYTRLARGNEDTLGGALKVRYGVYSSRALFFPEKENWFTTIIALVIMVLVIPVAIVRTVSGIIRSWQGKLPPDDIF